MINLILVRHGETAWNVDRRFQGHSDIPLNELGQKQAKAVGERLKDAEIDFVIASDLSRAKETAEAIAAHHTLSVHTDKRLRELAFGQWEGLTYSEIEAQYPNELAEWQENYTYAAPPDGETLSQARNRIAESLAILNESYENQTICLVAHGGTLQTLLCYLLGIDPNLYWQFRFKNCAVSKLSVYEQGPVIHLLNGDSHLIGLDNPHPSPLNP